MISIRFMTATAVLLALLLGSATTAWAVDVDLQIKTANPTNVERVAYRVESTIASVAGEDAQTAVTLALEGLSPGDNLLRTTFRTFKFTLASDGTITVPTGSHLSVSGTSITINNDVDLEDFEVRMRKTTGLSVIELRVDVGHENIESNYNTIVGSSAMLEGDEATTPVNLPLIGMVPGSRYTLRNNFGSECGFTIEEDGTPAAYSNNPIPATFESADPDQLIIENTIDLSGFGIRCKNATSLERISYGFEDYLGPGHFTPTSASTGPVDVPANKTSRTGSTAHTNTATFDLTGLVPTQRIRLVSSFGAPWFRVSSGGALVADAPSSMFTMSSSTMLIDNWVNIQNFTLRTENPVDAGLVTFYPFVYPVQHTLWVQWPDDVSEIRTTGSNASTGLSFPLTGIVPGMGLAATSSVGRCHFRPDEDGNLYVAPWYWNNETDGEIQEAANGDVSLVFSNPQELWVKVYGEKALPSTAPKIHHYDIRWRWATTSLDDAPRYDLDGADLPDGETFHLDSMGPHTGLAASIYVVEADNDRVNPGLWFWLNPDGTASFYEDWQRTRPANVSPTKGAVAFEVDGVANTLYVEIVGPPNTAPTVSIGHGENLTIASSAQSSTSLTASVDDEDEDDTLACSWFVDGALVSGPSAPADDGTCDLDLGDLDDLGVGSHTVRVEVSDGMFTATDVLVLTIDNSPPDVAVGGAGTYEIDDDVEISLTGSVSDYDGDEVTYAWKTADGTVLVSGTVDTASGGEPAAIPGYDAATTGLGTGTHVLTLSVEDEDNDAVTASVTVEVVDTTAPMLAPIASKVILWPPNHKMVEVVIDTYASDASGGSVAIGVTVESSEPPEFDEDGNFLPDFEIVSVNQSTGKIELDLRAERSGQGDGRTYTVTVTATDSSGNESSAVIEVKCPHDKKK